MIITEENAIKRALSQLISGNVVAVPTETVYGLAADISNEIAVKKIYSLKNRPTTHPLIVHIANKKDLQIYCQKIPNYVTELVNKLWPGPITFILHKTSKVPHYVTGNQDTVAIRMPAHPVTLELINELGNAIVAPSANKFMGISPTRPEHVIDEFGDLIAVLDGGTCQKGLESTIIDATQEDSYKILRPGFITSEIIDSILKDKYSHIKCSNNIDHNLKFPGNYLKHYSPKKPLVIFSSQSELVNLSNEFNKLYVIHYSLDITYDKLNHYEMSKTPLEFAKSFYHALRLGDNSNCSAIAIESPPITL